MSNDPLIGRTAHATIEIPEGVDMRCVSGPGDATLRSMERTVPGSEVGMSGSTLSLTAPTAAAMYSLMNIANAVIMSAESGRVLDEYMMRDIAMNGKESAELDEAREHPILTYGGKAISPKTYGQAVYANAIDASYITIGMGPAGCGKTYIAVAKSVRALKEHDVKRIVITRPAVEAAGESLGSLPGTLEEKMSPYMRPIFDSLVSMCSPDKVRTYMENGIIEIAPLAYMRGRTFDDTFIIADEMQNSTPEQAKMLLTRIGHDSRCVLEGDTTQADRRGPSRISGLEDAADVLSDVYGVSIVHLHPSDIVRSPIAAAVCDAYESRDMRGNCGKAA